MTDFEKSDAEEELLQLLDKLSGAFVLCEARRIVRLSPGMAELCGISEADARAARDLEDFFSEAQLDEFEKNWKRGSGAGRALGPYDLNLLRPGQERLPVQVLAQEFFSGKIQYCLLSLQRREGGDRKEDGRDDNVDFELLFQGTPLALLFVDSNAQILKLNPAATQLLGYGALEARELSLRDLFEERHGHGDAFQAIEKGRRSHFSGRLLDAQGRVFDADLRIEPRLAKGWNLVSIHDVSRLRSLEHDLDAAQRLESVGKLAGVVAHDFNNLLMLMQMHSDILLETIPESDPSLSSIQAIRNAVDTAASLTRRLLDFSGRKVGETQRFDLNSMLSRNQKFLQRLLGEKIRLELRVESLPYLIRADEILLEQILVSLCSNARDAMPRGGKLRIESQRLAKRGALAFSRKTDALPERLLSIQDQGQGIPSQNLERIFDARFSTKEGGKGEGMSLHRAQGIIRQWGGEIEVLSELGKGSTFNIYLPAAEEARAGSGLMPEPRSSFGRRLLLAEDDEALRQSLAKGLRASGYEVEEAADGLEALERFEKSGAQLDLLLTDIRMPRMDGLELMARILSRNANIRILSMSGEGDLSALGMPRGFSQRYFLLKPFGLPELLEKLRELESAPAPDAGRLLLVDADPLQRSFKRLSLLSEGYQVEIAKDAFEALALLRSLEIDAVLSEVNLPGMDGLGLWQAMKADSRLEGIPLILASTSLGEFNVRKRAEELGIKDFVALAEGDYSALNLALKGHL